MNDSKPSEVILVRGAKRRIISSGIVVAAAVKATDRQLISKLAKAVHAPGHHLAPLSGR